ncbi:MAG: hypothetical protein IID42_10940 [Planctomycetes bacterium]|nr:hypothetical protein [Planctomycetota bacterium]
MERRAVIQPPTGNGTASAQACFNAGTGHQGIDLLKRRYARRVKDEIKSGTVAERVLDQDERFRKMVESRRRYDKAIHTSFANRSDAIDESAKGKRGYKMKRQDGKDMTPEIRNDIQNIVDDFESVFGKMASLFRKTDITIAHTNGKHPLLSTAGGYYHSKERTVTVGRAKAGAHELAHWLDAEAAAAVGEDREVDLFMDAGFRRITRKRRCSHRMMLTDRDVADVCSAKTSDTCLTRLAWGKINNKSDAYRVMSATGKQDDATKCVRARLGAYWSRPCEVFARLVEQYVATELGRESAAAESPELYQNAPAYWTKEEFAELKPMVIKEVKRRIALLRKRKGT